MTDESTIDRLLADLKQRFALGSLTYAEAVMIEDLIAALAEVTAKSDVDPAEGAAGICPSGLDEAERHARPPRL